MTMATSQGWLFPATLGVFCLAASVSAFPPRGLLEFWSSRGGSLERNGEPPQICSPIRVIGLIGGISSGKSTVSQLMHERGATVIDADKLGHQAYAPGSMGFKAVVEAFGDEILDNITGTSINRHKLRQTIFHNEVEEVGTASADNGAIRAAANKAKLESILWPLIRSEIETRIRAAIDNFTEHWSSQTTAPRSPLSSPPTLVIVVEAALLLEAGWEDLCDEVWHVCVDHDTAVERLLDRDPHLKEEDVEERLRATLGSYQRQKLEREEGGGAASKQRRELLKEESCTRRELENSGSFADLRSQVNAAWEAAIEGGGT